MSDLPLKSIILCGRHNPNRKFNIKPLDLVDGFEKTEETVWEKIHLGADSEPHSTAHWVLITGKNLPSLDLRILSNKVERGVEPLSLWSFSI